MSAALVILPKVWACTGTGGALADAAAQVGQRKGPHALRLVQAASAHVQPVWTAPQVKRSVTPGLVFYRKYTEAMLRRYIKLSMECGRVPSVLGRELFRAQVSSYRVSRFDDAVIFVHDVGKCLAGLDPGSRHLVRRIALEDYTHQEAASLLGLSLRTVTRRYFEAIDKLTRMLLERQMLEPSLACEEAD